MPTKADEMICFALYSASHALSRAYNPMLKKLNLTYPQYITLMLLWEENNLTVGQICSRLGLESNTVTPMLKRLENQGYVTRRRNPADERQVTVALTESGSGLQREAPNITRCIIEATGQSENDLGTMVHQLQELREKVLSTIGQ